MIKKLTFYLVLIFCSCFRADKDAPIIEINGLTNHFHEIGKRYTDPGYTAWDKKDGDLSRYVEVTNLPDVYLCGLYEVKYNVNDASGNSAKEKRRVVIVGIGKNSLNNSYNAVAINSNNDTIYNHLSSIYHNQNTYTINNLLNRGIQYKLNFELSGFTNQYITVLPQNIDNSNFIGSGYVNDSAKGMDIQLIEINQDTTIYTLKLKR